MKRTIAAILSFATALSLCACGGGSAATDSNAAVKEKTDGRITIECHFAGELGDERSTIEQCQFGGLDFTRVSSGASAEFAPLMNALQMPYEYKDVDHLFKVLDGDIGQEVFDTFKDNNLVGITYLHPGSRNFFNSKKEIHTPADLAGMKIRVSESDLMLKMMESLGGVGVGLPFNDTYSSIQTGVVDGAENNMTSYIEMSFYEVAPYWTYDGHSYMPDMILASKQTMDKLSEDDQQIIFDCAKEAEEWHRTAWEDSEAKNAKIAEEKGCTLTTLTDDELKQFQDAVAPMYDSFLNDEQKAIVERVKAPDSLWTRAAVRLPFHYPIYRFTNGKESFLWHSYGRHSAVCSRRWNGSP